MFSMLLEWYRQVQHVFVILQSIWSEKRQPKPGSLPHFWGIYVVQLYLSLHQPVGSNLDARFIYEGMNKSQECLCFASLWLSLRKQKKAASLNTLKSAPGVT